MRISDWSSDVCSSDLVQEMTVHKAAGADIGLVAVEDLSVRVAVGNDAVDREVIFAREIEVALVVRRTAEDRTGAIVHQHIVDDPDRQMPVGIARMFDRKAGVEAQRSDKHTSELQTLMRNSYAVFCMKKKKTQTKYIM